MKKNVAKIISIFFLAVLSFSCSKKAAFDIIGSWTSERTIKNEMASQDDPFVNIAAVYMLQKNDFIFNEDGTFVRTVEQKTTKTETFTEELSADELKEYYSSGDTVLTLTGTYSLIGKKLTLLTKTIVDGDKELPYEEYYKSIQALGPAEFKVRVSMSPENELLIQDFVFKKN